MKDHFILEKERSLAHAIAVAIVFITVTIITLSLSFIFMYEYFTIPHYWKNRWTLYRLLKKGKVKVTALESYYMIGEDIQPYRLEIDGIIYHASIWNGKLMTLCKEQYSHTDYVGLFTGSVITRRLNTLTIKQIQKLSTPNA
jgi:hypothetical protein